MKGKEENRSVIEPSCTFFKPNNINFLPSNRVLDRKPDRVTGYKVLIDLTSPATKTRSELRCSWRVSRSCTTSGATSIIVKQYEHHLIWKWCWTPVCVNKYTENKLNNHFYKINGCIDDPNIVFMRKSKRTSQHGTKKWGHVMGQHEQSEPH